MKAPHYKRAGVDIVKNEVFVNSIQRMLKSSSVITTSVGGFSALYDNGGSSYFCAASDGVGTKLMLAAQYKKYFNIGIDLVAMSVNDIICCGGRPLFFLDYLSYSRLPLSAMEEIIAGIIAGCNQSRCLLIGGETAEMPGLYAEGAFDLAGFAVGEVGKDRVLDGSMVKAGDALLGLASSGFHANGFSLLRKMLEAHSPSDALIDALLAPTTIYVAPVHAALECFPAAIKGIAHITGSGFHNVKRINPEFSYCIDSLPGYEEVAPVFGEMLRDCGIPQDELRSTFNMGIGLVLVVESAEVAALGKFFRDQGLANWVIGTSAFKVR